MADNIDKRDIKELKTENERLKNAIEELATLNDIAITISSTFSLNEVIGRIVKKCVRHFSVSQCTVTLLQENDPEAALKTFIREADISGEVNPCRLDRQLTGWMLKNKKPLVSNDIKNDDRFYVTGIHEQPIHSLLSVPLVLKGRLIGSINLFNKKSGENFSDEEEKTLKIMQEEMKLAYNIQMDLLPKKPPEIAGYDISGKSIPAKAVGGDYFDFITAGGHGLVFCLGDVVGKGMPAALLMANIQATLRGQIENKLSLKKSMQRSNSLLFRSTNEDKFITLFLGKLDNNTHEIKYCNAGHNYPILFKRGKKSAILGTGGLVLGALEEFPYKEDAVIIERGDTLLIFSDGITEAFNEEEEQFGEKRLEEVVRGCIDCSAAEIVDEIISSVRQFAGEMEQSDDMTLMMIKRER
jgi:sigma-B regulation protein RsbU (phosphoserine phosphatase)